MNTAEKLDRIDDLEFTEQWMREKLDAEKQKLIDSVLTPEIKQKIDEINAEFAPKYDALKENPTVVAALEELTRLKAEVTAETIGAGETLRGKYKMAVLTKGKKETQIIVDTGMLKGMTVNIPKLQECWHEEEVITPPRVSFRKVT